MSDNSKLCKECKTRFEGDSEYCSECASKKHMDFLKATCDIPRRSAQDYFDKNFDYAANHSKLMRQQERDHGLPPGSLS